MNGIVRGAGGAPIPRATYRLQFHAGFGFVEAESIAPYLARLGISHVYASSYLKARPGSTHGYDIVDHEALNPELGTEAEFADMCAAFRRHGLGQLIDFVPNHMGVGGADNPYWLDVLEWGPHSSKAGWFDIDWDPDRRYLTEKLLAPVLGDQYGVALQNGDLALRFDPGAGSIAVWAYGEHKLPVCPLGYARILGDGHPALERIGDGFADLPSWRPQVGARADELKAALAAACAEDATARAALDASIAKLNADWRALDAIIADQYWRVASFLVAGDDINYRRFFNINDLAGIRMELPAVFDAAHRRVAAMLADGTVDGLRIDHIDGLLDPRQYVDRLRALDVPPFYLLVEKILARHEALRENWRVEGTTGYEFANLALELMVDPAGEAAFTEAYVAFTGDRTPFAHTVRLCKLRIMDNEMASELNVLGRDAGRIARQNPRTADFTRNLLQRALRQVIACFPVYRTYVDREAAASDTDRRDLDWALRTARRHEPELPPSVFDFLSALLTGDLVREAGSGFSREAALRVAMKFQQLSGPVMAKGLEDTAFYRYNRFVALNEVGGEPELFGITVAAFHRANAARARTFPHAMLGTSTHDTKRGEDVRARLAALSSLGEEWRRQVASWSRILRARRGDVEGEAPPARTDEYLLYQQLLGSWPVELLDLASIGDEASRAALGTYRERIAGMLQKSMREGKLHSNWTAPDEAYENAMQGFAADALDPDRPAFLAAFLPFAERVAALGVDNSLVQAALKLTLPGMPDFYQGCELWDLSLVDPDNRRPVDYGERSRLLERVSADLARDRAATMRDARARWRDGAVKLALTATLLELRAARPSLLAHGSYEPLALSGEGDALVGFVRRDPDATGDAVAVIACRHAARREAAGAFSGVTAALGGGGWRDLLTGRSFETGTIDAGALLDILPVAVLVPA